MDWNIEGIIELTTRSFTPESSYSDRQILGSRLLSMIRENHPVSRWEPLVKKLCKALYISEDDVIAWEMFSDVEDILKDHIREYSTESLLTYQRWYRAAPIEALVTPTPSLYRAMRIFVDDEINSRSSHDEINTRSSDTDQEKI